MGQSYALASALEKYLLTARRRTRALGTFNGKVGAVAQQSGGLSETHVMQFIAGYFAEGKGDSFTSDQ